MYVGGAALAAAGAGFLFYRLRKRDPEQIERRRRERLQRIGRVAQGEILEIMEPEPAEDHTPPDRKTRRKRLLRQRPLIVYRYTISGVRYEAAQDVLDPLAENWLAMTGRVASIRYDPANPSNSVLLAGTRPGPSSKTPNPATPEKGK